MLHDPSGLSVEMQQQYAADLMRGFADRTGLTSNGKEQRYLWTDSFAVCNFLGLADATKQKEYRDLAVRTVEHVHHTLGRYRADDRRVGWLSGLPPREGEAHPTRGGLRIGKDLPERRPDEPFDERLEWDRDGQYFHYLTQWMHALDRVTRSTGDPIYNVWARELAERAFLAFSVVASGGHVRRMYWKMNVDLSRPLVASMGKHDALDGYVTYQELAATASEFRSTQGPDVGGMTAELASMIAPDELATADPLGIGGLLIDAHRLHRLMRNGRIQQSELLVRLLAAALAGLEAYDPDRELRLPAERRLAFRELGLAIGLHGVERMKAGLEGGDWSAASRVALESLARYVPLATSIEHFWLDSVHRRTDSWTEHRNINEVMLATSLAPRGFLGPEE